MSFIDLRFPENISFGSSYGPRWNTSIVTISSGFEQRNQEWSKSKYRGDVAYGIRTSQDMLDLIKFFHEVRGRAYSFRFKDWNDYEASDEQLVVTGSRDIQLSKLYSFGGGNEYRRKITKPHGPQEFHLITNTGPVQITDAQLDFSTGVLSLGDSLFPKLPVSNITQSTFPTVTIDDLAEDFDDNDIAYFSEFSFLDFEYQELLADRPVRIDVLSRDTTPGSESATIQIVEAIDGGSIDTSGFQSFQGIAQVQRFPQGDEVVTWTGEFDNHVRFDTDELSATWDDYENLSTQVEIVEIKE
jgi:uncharacterized protein (TIGR02217 family)